jgi:internalin A
MKDLRGDKAVRYLANKKLVSQEWNVLMDEIKIDLMNRGNIELADLRDLQSKEAVLRFIDTNKDTLRTLNLPRSFGFNDNDIKTICTSCTKLETLSVPFGDITYKAFADIAGLSELKKLNLNGLARIDYTLFSQLTNLQSISFQDVAITDADIKTLLASRPNLKELTLKGEEVITNAALIDIGQFSELKVLELNECKNLSDFTPVDNLSKLTSLRIIHSEGNNKLPALTHLIHLRELELHFETRIQGNFPSLDHLQSLEVLKLYSKTFLAPGHAPITFPKFEILTGLKELSIGGSNLRQIPPLDSLVNLNKLTIVNAKADAVPDLDALHQLKELAFQNVYITDIPKLPDTLKKLKISNCGQIHSYPNLDQLVQLEELTLDDCNDTALLPPSYFISSPPREVE